MAKGVGVYIGTNEIIAVSVIHTVQGPQVKEYAVEPIHPEESEPPSVKRPTSSSR